MSEENSLNISSVHDALREAVIGSLKQKREPKENLTVRMDPNTKEELKRLCEVHGTTASDFLRSCADSLLKDYLGPSSFDRFAKSAVET